MQRDSLLHARNLPPLLSASAFAKKIGNPNWFDALNKQPQSQNSSLQNTSYKTTSTPRFSKLKMLLLILVIVAVIIIILISTNTIKIGYKDYSEEKITKTFY